MKQCCRDYLMDQFGDMDVSQEIYNEYVASMKAKLGEAESALSQGEWMPLDRIAHAIKGNALASGDNDVADTAIALRNAAKLADAADAAALVGKLKNLAQEL